MAKIDKEYVLSDSSVNTYGFRLLTSGYQMQEYKKNPIGYYMHNRDSGVLVRWDNLQIKGDEIIGIPDINTANPRASQTIAEINKGYLNAASMGHIVVLESSDAANLKLPNQTGPTITKWFNRECSLVDIPANENALSLYDKNDNLIPLNLFAGIKNLNSEMEHPEENVNVDDLLKTAVKDKSITPEQSAELAKHYKDCPEKLTKVLHDFGQNRVQYLNGLSWDDLDKKGLLPELKQKHFAGFTKKFFLQFGKHYKDSKEPKEKENGSNGHSLDSLIKLALDQGDVDAETIAGWKRNFANNPQRIRELVEGKINSKTTSLEGENWDELDKGGNLEHLKKHSFQTFKHKFKEKFGIDYKENKN